MSVLPPAKVNFGALLVAGRNRAIAAPANPATTAQPQYRRMSLFSIECQWFLLACVNCCLKLVGQAHASLQKKGSLQKQGPVTCN